MLDDRRCIATARTTGQQCRNAARLGTTVCRMHGGSAPQVQAAARRRIQRQVVEGSVAALMDELGVDALDDRNLIDDLVDAVRRCRRMVTALGHLVGGLSADPGWEAYSTTEQLGRLVGTNHLGDGAPHVLATLYAEWTERLARASKLALDAGVEERRLRLEEDQVDQLEAAVTAALSDILGLVEQLVPTIVWAAMKAQLAEEAPRMVGRRIRAIEAEPQVQPRATGRGR